MTNTSIFSSVKTVKKKFRVLWRLLFSWDRRQCKLAELYRSLGKFYCRYYQKKEKRNHLRDFLKVPWHCVSHSDFAYRRITRRKWGYKIASFLVLQIHHHNPPFARFITPLPARFNEELLSSVCHLKTQRSNYKELHGFDCCFTRVWNMVRQINRGL